MSVGRQMNIFIGDSWDSTQGGRRQLQTARGGSNNNSCYRCGCRHLASSCRDKESDCFHCGKKGHISRACHGRRRVQTPRGPAPPPNTNPIDEEDMKEDDVELHTMFPVQSNKYPPIYVTVWLIHVPTVMEVDTGATLSVMSEETSSDMERQPTTHHKVQGKAEDLHWREYSSYGSTTGECQSCWPTERASSHNYNGKWPDSIGEELVGDASFRLEGSVPAPRCSKPGSCILATHESVFKKELGTITCAKQNST